MSSSESRQPSPLPSRPLSPLPLNPRKITSPDQISVQFALLTKRQAELSLSLNALAANTSQTENALAKLSHLGERIQELVGEVDGRKGSVTGTYNGLGFQPNGHDVYEEEDESLVERVKKVWETSERVGGKVKALDQEVGRIKESTDILTEVIELKDSLQTLASAMAKEDWESASRACRRAMSVRKQVIEGNFANSVVPTSQYPLSPSQTLQELRNVLLQIFRREFDAAVAHKDEPNVSRFFRLWPSIGAEEEGLRAYGDFVVGLVKVRSQITGKTSSPLYYLTSLTNLFESVAHIIDQHQSVVEKYYGHGRMATVVKRLVGESDSVVRGLVEGWEEERRVGRLISDTKKSPFLLISNPNLLPPLFPSLLPSNANPITLATLASTTTSALPNLSSASNLLQSYTQGGKKTIQQTPPVPLPEEDTGPDPKDVDKVLGELVALGGRWALFRTFIWNRIADGGGQLNSNDTPMENGERDTIISEEAGNSRGPSQVQLGLLEESESQQVIENLLKVYYEPLELWFLRMSIEKAHKLDSPETFIQPHLSSILDDTFYLLRLIISRLLSCGSLSILKSMRIKITEVIEIDYLGILKRRMENVYTVQGSGERRERERDQRQAFIIYLNNVDVSADYTERLVEETLQRLPQIFLDMELPVIREELGLFKNVSNKFKLTSRNGIEQLFNQLIRPGIRPLLDESYKDVSYLLDEDAFGEVDEMDLVRKRFIRIWEGLMDGYKESFTDHNYQLFFSLTVEVLVRHWEKMILSMRFTELGAIRYERDIRSIMNYLSSQTPFGGAREKFTRLHQIGTILNLDAEEDPEDFYSNSGVSWRISKLEYDSILEQRQ
ncbi:uncharacterized protein L203_100310 [Cryptococcus depauperatus CBS 7841]|uniref:Conserved oligomeric Golgi complex subunit 4 n=1 Tax=Cryptococcus depauperatus CBS 7841 TaxID=1295531 RepID=A0AAJ8LVQ5_9TREE